MAKSARPKLDEVLKSIADTIKDYRRGEIAKPTAEHVKKWLRQFPTVKQTQIATEMNHLLAETYYSKAVVKEYLTSLVDCADLLDGKKPEKFWKKVNFIRVQQRSQSQSDLLDVLGGILHSRFGYWSRDCGSKSGPYFYLDDFIFTGSTVRREILRWLENEAPKNPRVHIAVLAYHSYGQYYAGRGIEPAVEELGGDVSFWRAAVIEDRKASSSSCDVLRPRKIYSDKAIREYAAEMSFEPALRDDRTTSQKYKSENGRRVLESEFLRAGLRIREFGESPERALRPLGFSSLDGFGCGAIVATYRNCPNNCPLAWWWGDPTAPRGHTLSKWYPLLPRKYNIH
jgi:hypothetical protein